MTLVLRLYWIKPVSMVGLVIGRALMTGSVASAISAGVLGALAKAEGKEAVQPINATSHWLHGEEAWVAKDIDVEHTATGYATHHAANVFWATLFETLQTNSSEPGLAKVVRDAALVSTIAAVVDYGLMPKRLTPGWEGPLPIRSVVGGFLGMACGLAIGGLVTRRVLAR